jgi:hypothetical protein
MATMSFPPSIVCGAAILVFLKHHALCYRIVGKVPSCSFFHRIYAVIFGYFDEQNSIFSIILAIIWHFA